MLAVLGQERVEARSLSFGCFIAGTDDLSVITVPVTANHSYMQSYSSHGGGVGPQLTWRAPLLMVHDSH